MQDWPGQAAHGPTACGRGAEPRVLLANNLQPCDMWSCSMVAAQKSDMVIHVVCSMEMDKGHNVFWFVGNGGVCHSARGFV